MYDLYLPLVKNPNPDAVIQVEKITGPILIISSKMDNMWPSEPAAEQIMKRLEDYDFPYSYQHLSYDRGKNKEAGLKCRLDSLTKTLEFISQW